MFKAKKMLALLLAFSMLTLTACGGQEAVTEESAPAATEEAATEETASEGSELTGTLNYISWMTKGEDIPTLDAFMAENPGVEVVNRSLDGSNYSETLAPLLLNGDVPDVFLVKPAQLQEYAKEGYIKPITDYEGVAEQATNSPGVHKALCVGDEIYGYAVNGNIGNEFVYYNKLFFEENNLQIPTTVEEFDALCAQIKELGQDPLLVPAGDIWQAPYFVYNHILASLADLGQYGDKPQAEIGLLKGEIKISDVYGSAFRKLAEYCANGWISPGGLSMGWETATQYLVDGGAAMLCSGNWVPGSTPIQENTNAEFELGAFPLPGVETESGTLYAMGEADRVIVLSATSEYPEAQDALFYHFIDDENLTNYCNEQGLMGVNVTSNVDPVMEYSNGVLADYTMVTYNLTNMPTSITPNFYQYCADVCSGADVEQLLQKLDADFDAAMSSVDAQEYLSAIE